MIPSERSSMYIKIRREPRIELRRTPALKGRMHCKIFLSEYFMKYYFNANFTVFYLTLNSKNLIERNFYLSKVKIFV